MNDTIMTQLKDELEQKLYDHLGFGGVDGTYIYVLTRVKEAFGFGTMTLDDFQEIDGDFVGELADFFVQFMQEKGLEIRRDVSTMKQHDSALLAVLKELKGVGD